MKGLFDVLLIFVIVSPCLCSRLMTLHAGPYFNVVNYGATGDGHTDDSNAFVKAWRGVCGATQGTPTLLIPKGKTFMLQPVLFQGPCKAATVNIKVDIINELFEHNIALPGETFVTHCLQGTIIAPESVEAWKWLNNDDKKAWVRFSGINGLVVNGRGQVDGQGAAWWKQYNQNERPTALQFVDCENLTLSTLTHINSPRNHISIDTCSGASISKLHIIAPEDSPNTDGIDIANSSNVVIANSTIGTGDDCIAINSGSTFINITGVFCGPGHGISVGSLGKDGDYAIVEEVRVHNCTLNGTTNGARIKTWTGGCGYARKITFEDIKLVGVKNPVIINQQYYDSYKSASEAVKVSNVTYRNVMGTSISQDAIQLNCDHTVGCTDIILDNVNITSVAGRKTYASCNNAQGICSSCYPNVPCLS